MGQKKKVASLNQLKAKPAVTRNVSLVLEAEDGTTEEVDLILRSIGSYKYDKLMADNPPTKEQKDKGEHYNMTTFAPRLLAATVKEPETSVEDWEEIFNSESWTRGELMNLFMAAVMVNTAGLDLDPTEPG